MATETDGTAHGGEAVGKCIGADGSSIGMPQLCFDWFPNQIFWLVITLVVIYLVLSRVALPRIGAVLAERADTITHDIAAAEDLKLKAQEAEAVYEKALADARAEAQRIIAKTKVEFQKDLDANMATANAEIAARAAESEKRIAEIRASALDSVTIVAKDTVGEIVAALGAKVDAKSIAAAVSARLKG